MSGGSKVKLNLIVAKSCAACVRLRVFSTANETKGKRLSALTLNAQPTSNGRRPRKRFSVDMASVVLLAVPVSTFALGCWQMKRMSWKRGLIEKIESRTNAKPVEFAEVMNSDSPLEDMEFFPTILRGRFLNEKEFQVMPRSRLDKAFRQYIYSYSGQQTATRGEDKIGAFVITPFQLIPSGQTVLVNRGWVPLKLQDPKKRQNGNIEGPTVLTAVIRKPVQEVPLSQPSENSNVWNHLDVPAMAKIYNIEPIYLDADFDSTISGGPIGGQTNSHLRDQHFSYLLTWFGISAVTLIMLFQRCYR